MTQEKKIYTSDQIVDHVREWGLDKLDKYKDMYEKVYSDQYTDQEKKDGLYGALAEAVYDMLFLLEPIEHEEDYLIEWAQDFLDEYATYQDCFDD